MTASLSTEASTVARPVPASARLARAVSFRRISALYIFVALFIVFSLWVPATFLSADTWRSLLDTQALTALTAVALVIPVAAGAFNLAIGAEVGLGAILAAWLVGQQEMAIPAAVLLTLLGGAVVGLGSGLLITKFRIDSFIATLGLSSVLLALIAWISGNQQILNLPAGFQSLGTDAVLGVTLPVWIMLGVTVLVWYVLEVTPTGRRVYATGGNKEAARLAGIRTQRVIVASLVACGTIAALAGLLNSATLATGDPTIGPAYLLPAFSAVFLGSTQFRDGRFNVWGTIVASYVLATGVKGLQLAGAPVWVPDLFNGAALIVAVGLAQLQSVPGRQHPLLRLIRPRRGAAQASSE